MTSIYCETLTIDATFIFMQNIAVRQTCFFICLRDKTKHVLEP